MGELSTATRPYAPSIIFSDWLADAGQSESAQGNPRSGSRRCLLFETKRQCSRLGSVEIVWASCEPAVILSKYQSPFTSPRGRSPDDRDPMAPHPVLSAYLFRPIRESRSARTSVRGSAVRDGASGFSLAAVPAAYRQGNAVDRRQADGCDRGVGPRRIAYRQTDPDRSAVCNGRVPEKRSDPARDRSRGGFRTQIPSLADRQARVPCSRPLYLPCHDRTQPGSGWPLGRPRRCLSADRAYDIDALRT